MPTDLASQLRQLVDAVEPVTAREAAERAAASGTADPRAQRPAPAAPAPRLRPALDHRRRLHGRVRPAAAVVVAVAIAGAAGGWALARSGTGAGQSVEDAPGRVQAVLTAGEVRHVAASSSAAMAATGTATVTETAVGTGPAAADSTVEVTFDGTSVDERIHVTPSGSGGAPFTVEDRLVDGQLYLFTPGPDDVARWYHDTGEGSSSLSFPDPRTLYTSLGPAARLAVVGSTTAGGRTLTHLRALDPAAVDATMLPGHETGTLRAFDLWVDRDHVVHRLAYRTTQTDRACTVTPGSLPKAGAPQVIRSDGSKVLVEGPAPAGPTGSAGSAGPAGSAPAGSCTTRTSGLQVTVAFADIGTPLHVVAPSGAVDVQGKG